MLSRRANKSSRAQENARGAKRDMPLASRAVVHERVRYGMSKHREARGSFGSVLTD